MAKKTYIYKGKRSVKHGITKDFDSKMLDEAKIKRLQNKGWEEVKPKPKPKPKPKAKKNNA